MPAYPKRRHLTALVLAGAVLPGAAPVPQASRLAYDPAVFLEGSCLSPALAGCSLAAPSDRTNASASEALLEAGSGPRLPYEFAGLLETDPQLMGGVVIPADLVAEAEGTEER
jgi:hypothetical protein